MYFDGQYSNNMNPNQTTSLEAVLSGFKMFVFIIQIVLSAFEHNMQQMQ